MIFARLRRAKDQMRLQYEEIIMRTTHPSRRDWLRLSAAGVLTASASGWLPALAEQPAAKPRHKACILLWMTAAPLRG